MNKPMVPADFVVPTSLETSEFRLRTLTVNDVVKDYDAVMTSINSIQGVFGKGSNWPTVALTLEQDLIDLGWHQKEFQRRSSFAYTLMSLDENRCLGCMYIYPSDRDEFDAQVIFWVRESESKSGLERRLFEIIKKWMQEKFLFKNIDYPGRDLVTGARI